MSATTTPLGLEDEAKALFYPNPANQYITFHFSGAATVKIIDLSGKVVIKTNIISNEPVDVSTLKDGYYAVQLIQNQAVIKSGKVMIKH